MRSPDLAGEVERRLLINYRVDPEVIAARLPLPFRPQVVDGWAVAGICLIRLGSMRPLGLPTWVGLRSENAAHRVAVEWDSPGGTQTGVYIPRRDSNSMVNVLVGGRLFPGEHHRADFHVSESAEEIRVAFTARDGSADVNVAVAIKDELAEAGCSRTSLPPPRSSNAGPFGSQARATRTASTALRCVRTRGALTRPTCWRRTRRSSPTHRPFRRGLPSWTARWSCGASPSPGSRSRPSGCREQPREHPRSDLRSRRRSTALLSACCRRVVDDPATPAANPTDVRIAP